MRLDFIRLAVCSFLLCGCALVSGLEDRKEQLPFIDAVEIPDTDAPDADVEEELEIPPSCGNGILDPDEECDDGNDVNGDGCNNDCTLSCYDNSDCDDGLFCNGEDVCTDGVCVSGGNPCYDGIVCTDDVCDESSDSCENVVIAGQCLINDTCYNDGDADPSNDCRECRSSTSEATWTAKADMEPCAGGLCCDGVCRPGADCCSDSDCAGSCTGTALPCSAFLDMSSCISQSGCGWSMSESYCAGTHWPCDTYVFEIECFEQMNCTWTLFTCMDFVCQ